jgi:arylsulfatase A-like enzyme/nicotinamidase-related amidase
VTRPPRRGPVLRLAAACIAAALAVVTTGLRVATAASPAAGRPPNVILILADDLGAKELGCYGHPRHRTPHLDRLASEGTRFETFFSHPLCTPTRMALMTGQYGFHNGFLGMANPAFTPAKGSPQAAIGSHFTHADLLASRGYATALVGKWQLAGALPTLVRDAGFDEYMMWAYDHNLPPGVTHPAHEKGGNACRYWHPSIIENGRYRPTTPDDYGPDLFNDFCIDFARRHADRPFFVYYTSVLTHSPHLETPDPEHPGGRRPATFRSNLEYLDHLMGRLLAALDKQGLADDTVVIFIGDNGTGGDGKGTVTERGARTPCIIRGPGVRRGAVSRAVADITDIMPTLAELSGARLPADRPFDGASLVPVLRGDQERHRDWIYSHLDDGRVLRDARWLLELPGGGRKERFFDCGASRDGSGYRDVTDSADPEVRAAWDRFAEILAGLPEPKPREGAASRQNDRRERRKRRQNAATAVAPAAAVAAAPVDLTFRRASGLPRRQDPPAAAPLSVSHTDERGRWDMARTAVVVCDVWDLHHCRNAVRRLEEFAPRIDALLNAARSRGATIIHAPSDCMPAYADHPARRRAEAVPIPADLPPNAALWCSRLPREADALYPVDQSDGGEDDDPAEHAAWMESLRSRGRSPGPPWRTQSPLVTIDADRDFITDRGDEALAILRQQGIRHVLMTGVHTNMCVLGRPFGIRRLLAAGLDVALVRDLTDSMYNPRAWPFVDHFTGHDLVVAYVEQHLCPTVTSDAILGGEPFRPSSDGRPRDARLAWPATAADPRRFETHWSRIDMPLTDWRAATGGLHEDRVGPAWYRCAIVVPRASAGGLVLELPGGPPAAAPPESLGGWWNGTSLELESTPGGVWRGSVPAAAVVADEANMLVLRVEHSAAFPGWREPMRLRSIAAHVELRGGWQLRLGDDPAWAGISLPAKFGASADVVFELHSP